MRNRFFFAALSSLLAGLGGCAESAVEDDLVDGGSDGTDLDAGVDGGGDGDATGRRDAGPSTGAGRPDADPRDASSADAGRTDAGGMDSSVPGATDAGGARPDTGAPKPDAGTDAGKPDAGATCSSGALQCGGACVDTKTSNQHCGGCGMVCNNGQTCSDSKCTTPVVVPNGCTAKTFEDHTYLFCTNSRSWGAARSVCLDAKMDLAVIGSNAESDFVKGNGDSWFGGNDLGNERTWRAPVLGNAQNNNGANLGFTRWNQGEPSNTERCDGLDIFVSCLGRRSDEDCGMVLNDGKWNDADCDNNLRYVCEQY